MLKSLLGTPSTDYTDYYDLARFQLAWNINLLLVTSLLPISIYFFFFNTTFFVQYSSGFLICFIALIYLFTTKKFVTVSHLIVWSTLTIVISSLFLVKGIPHLIEPLWLVIIVIFSYFNLGKTIGHIILFIVIEAVGIYFFFFLNANEIFRHYFTIQELTGIFLEFSLCMVIIAYIVYQFIQTNHHAESKLRMANSILAEQNQQILAQNEEKTVLIQEIHHRVKNNLQVITSLLRLQSAEVDSELVKYHFQDAINRVMTMSLIHQKMYQNEELSKIEVQDYFNTLICDLIRSSSVKIPVNVTIESHLQKVGMKTIVPFALLISELVSNSLKHAFMLEGSIHLIINNEVDNKFIVTYSDNGIWKENGQQTSFGLQLIEALTEQLNGTIKRNNDANGTHYEISLENVDV